MLKILNVIIRVSCKCPAKFLCYCEGTEERFEMIIEDDWVDLEGRNLKLYI